MSFKTALLVFVYVSVALALPIRREVPQEHSHEPFLTSVRASLNLNNPNNIQDPVFGLLGNAAAIAGAGKITDATCLQQATADQAFTNAKAAGNTQGMVDALIYRALERNSGAIGLVTAPCTSIKAVNPEIAAIQQHQDPASDNAAAVNKAIVLELAKQIAAIGGNPQDALKSGTFAPGSKNDATAKGNTCDDANDANGCIFTQNLLVPDATAAEIDAAVAGIAAGTGAAANTVAADTSATVAASTSATVVAGISATATACANAVTSTVTVTVDAAATATAAATTAAATTAAVTTAAVTTAAVTTVAVTTAAATTAAPATTTATAASTAGNLQTFTGALGGVTAPAVTVGDRGFVVSGSDSFLNSAAALGRSCDIQHNQCANIANSAAGRAQGITVGQCDTQNTACRAAI